MTKTASSSETRPPNTPVETVPDPSPHWTLEDANELYGFSRWGHGYFGINEKGNVCVRPGAKAQTQVDVHSIVQGLKDRDLHAPVLLRFSDILAHRLREIRETFDSAMATAEYRGKYTCVYPIKVNQQRHLCEEIAELGRELKFGLEAGSKPELLAVLALTKGDSEMPILCNGFKDHEFVETVVLASKLGRNITLIVERFHELEMLIRIAAEHKIEPRMGIRVKLSSSGAGRWEQSAGARGKFGLTVSDLLRAMDFLKAHNKLHCMQLLHCHIGSQVYDIRHISQAVSELTHVYIELKRLGAAMGYLDIGGGLGVDYDGSRTATDSSINYSVEEYAWNVAARVKSACDEAKVEHPHLITESGRAMVAYASVLVCEVVGKSTFRGAPDLDQIDQVMKAEVEEEDEVPQPLNDLLATYKRISGRPPLETYHSATLARDEAMSLFALGYMSLPARAATEELFWSIMHGLFKMTQEETMRHRKLPVELESLPAQVGDIYFCNFSLFQSVPDLWAIDQRFPICPIHRLLEQPTERGVLADITCDSDGRVDTFVDAGRSKPVLELHELNRLEGTDKSEPYYLGFFLIGAYQEILGDLHNLFGDTHAVHVSIDDDGDWNIEEVVEGDSVRKVLDYVQFDEGQMRRTMRRDVERAVKEGRLSVAEGKSFLQFYERGLEGYTYLED